MSIQSLVDELVVKNPVLSKTRNQLVGKGYIAGLKALVSVLNIPKPTMMTGRDSSIKLCQSMSQFGLERVLIVTDEALYKIGVLDKIIQELDLLGMGYSLFTGVEPDPSFRVVEAGLSQLHDQSCDCVMAIGGGSSIDVAKVIALAAANEEEPRKLVGILKAKTPSMPFFVIPTTAGTGSEVTIGAVISDTKTHKKELVIDTKIVPLLAALDPSLMQGLPPAITAATGIDALTHLVEGYLSTMASHESDYYARAGIKMIFENLPIACKRGKQIKARENMALASYYGGLTINMAGLGYVHAFAHQLGALYKLPHGESNAKVLPKVLEFNIEASETRLSELACAIGLNDDNCSKHSVLARRFVTAVQALIADCGIAPEVIGLKQADFDDIIASAFKEANSTYAVPRYMSYRDAKQVLLALMP